MQKSSRRSLRKCFSIKQNISSKKFIPTIKYSRDELYSITQEKIGTQPSKFIVWLWNDFSIRSHLIEKLLFANNLNNSCL